jgi:hypothetical protein
MTTQITANNITAGTITSTQLLPGSLAPRISSISICDASYNILDDTAANTTGGYIQISGANFGSNSQIVIGTNNATSVTFVNTSTIRAQVGVAAAATYPVYVIDTDTGATAIKVNGLSTSSFPAWSTGATLTGQNSGNFFGINLSVSSDSNITYANTTALPAGTTLAANGYFSGTVSIGSTTTYNFTVDAKDAENQNAVRSFSMTVTVIPATKLWSWGNNNQGQLGLNNYTYKSSPTQIGTGVAWANTSIGQQHSAATKTDGTLWTWGRGAEGQLGLGTTIEYSSPKQVGTGTTWSSVVVNNTGTGFTAAIKTDGTLWLWGRNNYGRLGTTYGHKSSPAQVGALTTWSQVSLGHTHTAAVKTDGTLWTWGLDSYGALGLSVLSPYINSPTQVGTGTNWKSVSLGPSFMGAIKTDGTLWLCGYGVYGRLGLGDSTNKSSPVQLGTDTNWSMISCRYYATLATKTDGTLWAWGNGSRGQLGLNDGANRNSPVQVGTGTTWNKVSSGGHSLAIKTDGTLWAWGRQRLGALGLNNSGNYVYVSSPIQVGTETNWSTISAALYTSIAITTN